MQMHQVDVEPLLEKMGIDYDRSQSCKYRRPIARAEQIADCHHADQDDERHDISQQNRDRSRTSGYSDRHPVAGTIRRRSRSTYLHDFLPGLTQTAGFAGLAAPTSAMRITTRQSVLVNL